jgi:DNA-binding transcriptional ArsR family regulator
MASSPRGSDRLDDVLHALADRSRRSMVERLVRGPASVGELATPLTMTLPAVLQHLQVLEEAGLVRTEKVGRVRLCRLVRGGIRPLTTWLARVSIE